MNNTKSLVEPHGDLVDTAFTQFTSDMTHNMDSLGRQENEEVSEELDIPCNIDPEKVNEDIIDFSMLLIIIQDEEPNASTRSLNKNLNYVHRWAVLKIIH